MKSVLARWTQAFLLVCNSIFAVLLWEWLFFITKPSFFSVRSLHRQLLELFIAASPVLLIGAFVLVLLAPLAWLWERAFRLLTAAIAALLLGTGLLLMIDTVTITLFSWGIRDITFPWSLLYISGIAFVLSRLTYLFDYALGYALSTWRAYFIRALPTLCVSVFGLPLYLTGALRSESEVPVSAIHADKLPNILLFAGDGIDADHLSMYGYERDTTPHLAEFIRNRALLIENATSNAHVSYSSDLSLLTGKEPATLKVFSLPQTLDGENVFQHLPGILRGLGYRTFQASSRHFADAYQSGMQAGFDEANNRVAARQPAQLFRLMQHHIVGLFLDELLDRVRSRVMLLLGQPTQEREYTEMTGIGSLREYSADKNRSNAFLEFLSRTPQPFFAHIHLMGTHCCGYSGATPFFSAPSDKASSDNRYDDAIRDIDAIFQEIINALEAQHRLDNTIVIFHSDHPRNWTSVKRIPLIFVFPRGEFSGRRKHNAQLIDVAPTVLDYLGVPIPSWMEGVSLLRKEAPRLRASFLLNGLMQSHQENVEGVTGLPRLTDPSPPFYGVLRYGMKICNRLYEYKLQSNGLSARNIPSHSAPCAPNELPNNIQARAMLSEHLRLRGIGR